MWSLCHTRPKLCVWTLPICWPGHGHMISNPWIWNVLAHIKDLSWVTQTVYSGLQDSRELTTGWGECRASEGMTGPEPHSFTGRVERSRRWTGLLGASEAAAQLLDPQPLTPSRHVPKPTTRRAQCALGTFHPLDYLMTSLSPTLRQAGYNFFKSWGKSSQKNKLCGTTNSPFLSPLWIM